MPESVMDAFAEAGSARSDPGLRPQCVSFVQLNGNRMAFPYAQLLWAELNLSGLLQVHYSTHTVTLEGRNLDHIYDALTRHELTEVVQVDEKKHQSKAPEEPVVTRMQAQESARGEADQWVDDKGLVQ